MELFFVLVGACILVWRDSFVLLGNDISQKFNLTTQKWSTLNTKFPNSQLSKFIASMAPVNSPGCLVMPNEEVLVVGSGIVGSYRKAYAYNVQTNKWRSLSDMIHDQGMDNLY